MFPDLSEAVLQVSRDGVMLWLLVVVCRNQCCLDSAAANGARGASCSVDCCWRQKLCLEDSCQRLLGTFFSFTVLCCKLQVPARWPTCDSEILRPKKLLVARCALSSTEGGVGGWLPSASVIRQCPKCPRGLTLPTLQRTKCWSLSFLGGPGM